MDTATIDLEALRHQGGDVPWGAIENAIAAVLADPIKWKTLGDSYYPALHDKNDRGFLPLYVAVILGEAGRKMVAPEQARFREEIAGFLLDALEGAQEHGDEFALDELQYACGRIGPSILPEVVRRIAKSTEIEFPNYEMWGLLPLAKDISDAALRDEVVRLCIEKVECVLRDEGEASELYEVLHTLAALRSRDAQAVLEQLGREKRDELEMEILWDEYKDTLSMVRGDSKEEAHEEVWEREPKKFLEMQQEHWKDWHARRDAGEFDDDDNSTNENEIPGGRDR